MNFVSEWKDSDFTVFLRQFMDKSYEMIRPPLLREARTLWKRTNKDKRMLFTRDISPPDDTGDSVELRTVRVYDLYLRFLELDGEVSGVITYRLVSPDTFISL